MSKRREFVAGFDPDHLCLDGFDAAILGVTQCPGGGQDVVAYSINRILAKLERQMTQDEAFEYFHYNILGSYMGDQTPIFIWEYGKNCG